MNLMSKYIQTCIFLIQKYIQSLQSVFITLPHGLAVRIAGSHPAGPGSTPGGGTQTFLIFLVESLFSCSMNSQR